MKRRFLHRVTLNDNEFDPDPLLGAARHRDRLHRLHQPLLSSTSSTKGSACIQTIRALPIHLLPILVLTTMLAIAWRREWVGALCYGLAGAHYIWTVAPRSDLSVAVRLSRCGAIEAGCSNGVGFVGRLQRRLL